MRKPGLVRGKHYTEFVSEVESLKRKGRLKDAEKLLLELIDAVEEEARARGPGWAIAPWYYQQLAIIYRKQKNYAAEINILKRYVELTGLTEGGLADRLKKAEYLLQRTQEKTASQGEPCSYCGKFVTPLPQRRKKCPHCGKVVYVKPDQSFFPKALLTEDEAWAVEKLKALQEYGVTTEMFREAWKTEEEMVERSTLYNSLSKLRRLMALHLHEEGKNPNQELMLSHEAELRYLLALYGPDCSLVIVAKEDACPECQRLSGKTLTVKEALETMPLPVKGCTHTEGKNLHPLCRCKYLVSIEEEEAEGVEEAKESDAFQGRHS
ncbi:MAG: tetratricopeptide repeat protein [Candidatus Freyarchaeota archaeon]